MDTPPRFRNTIAISLGYGDHYHFHWEESVNAWCHNLSGLYITDRAQSWKGNNKWIKARLTAWKAKNRSQAPGPQDEDGGVARRDRRNEGRGIRQCSGQDHGSAEGTVSVRRLHAPRGSVGHAIQEDAGHRAAMIRRTSAGEDSHKASLPQGGATAATSASTTSPKTGDSKGCQPATPVAPPNITYMKESPAQPPEPTSGPSPSPGIQSDSVRTIHEGMPLPMPYEVITSGGRTTVDSEASLPSPSISVMRSYKNARCRQIALQSDLADALVRQGVEEQAILGRWLPPGLVQA